MSQDLFCVIRGIVRSRTLLATLSVHWPRGGSGAEYQSKMQRQIQMQIKLIVDQPKVNQQQFWSQSIGCEELKC